MKIKTVWIIFIAAMFCFLMFIITSTIKQDEPHINGWYTDAREVNPHPAVKVHIEVEDPIVGEEDPTPDMTWEYVPLHPGQSYTVIMSGVNLTFSVDRECRGIAIDEKLMLEVR